MKRVLLLRWWAAAAAVGLCCRAEPAFAWTGDPARGAAQLEREWSEIEHPRPTTGIRGVFRFALEAAGLRWHPERVEAALALAQRMQDRDPASKTCGNFHWRYDHTRVEDQNAAEFSCQLGGLLLVRYADALSPAGRERLGAVLGLAVEGLHRHAVPLSYSNISLMKAWDLIALGEGLHRPDVAGEGYDRFREWLRYTVVNGISEYGAVTYYGVDLDSLGLMARFAGRPEGRAQAEKALTYLWTDIAANWWTPGDRLASANSRSYDYLWGRGYLEAHTWTAGWLRRKPELENAGWLSGPHGDLVTFLRDATWVPAADITERLRGHVPRVVVQRWMGTPLEERATAYIGQHISLASAGGSHGNDERTLVADLGDSPRFPEVILFMDGRGDPYGTIKTENSANQAKALHLSPFICTVQRGAEVLQLLSETPNSDKGSRHLACLLSQLTVPAQAQVRVGGRLLRPGTPDEPAAVDASRPVFLEWGDAVIGLRFLYARSGSGAPAPIGFISDGDRLPARRLTVVHDSGPPRGRATLVVWFRAAEGLDDAARARFERAFGDARAAVKAEGDEVRVDASGLAGPLRIHANLKRREREELAGQEPDGLLAVNGYDIGRELLEEFGAR